MARNKQCGMRARRLAGMIGSLLALALVTVASTYGASRVHANSGPGGTTVTTYETPGAATPTPQPPQGTVTTLNGQKVIVSNGDIAYPGHPKPGPWVTQPNCAQPPAQSVRDHATFTPAEQQLYGIPQREKGESFDHWAKYVRSLGTRVCQYRDTGTVNGFLSPQSQQSQQRPADINNPGNAAIQIWAGNIADEPVGGTASWEVQHSDQNAAYWYTEMDSDWYIPCIQGTQVVGNSDAWIGLGGTNGNDQLSQAGSESDFAWLGIYPLITYYVWWEYRGPKGSNQSQQLNFNPLQCGDHIYVKIWGSDCYVVDNLSRSGEYFSQCTGPTYSNYTAEAIIERKVSGSTCRPLANYGTVKFQGVGITESNLIGYAGFPDLYHDYSHMTQPPITGSVLAWTRPIVYDSNDYPYDDFNIDWNAGGVDGC